MILSETPELLGTEEILAGRCRNEEISRRLLRMIAYYEEDFRRVGETPEAAIRLREILQGELPLWKKSLWAVFIRQAAA